MATPDPMPLVSRKAQALRGKIRVPGDKSMSHRALMFGAVALGETRITGLLEAEDVLNTARAVTALGAMARRDAEGGWRVQGVGVAGLQSPSEPLDFGNSGTGVRLTMGLIATNPIVARCIGDASLSKRPMGRVIQPLELFGARFEASDGGRLPLTVHGARNPVPITFTLPMASAQVKSAVLLAGLNTPGRTTVIEPIATRDHTERMLKAFGAQIEIAAQNDGRHISITGQHELRAQHIDVPGDPSSAAFAIVAALIVEGSDLTVESIMLNPTRTGLIETLVEMGGNIAIENRRLSGGEEVGDIRVRGSRLHGIRVPAARAPSMIDEYPILACLAAFAEGETAMEGLAELKVKESDRLAATEAGLAACGVSVRVEGDDLFVQGKGEVRGGALVETRMDHRIAMAFLTLGLGARTAVTVDDVGMIKTSFPDFVPLMTRLGANLRTC